MNKKSVTIKGAKNEPGKISGAGHAAAAPDTFSIKRPLLLLALIALVVYLPTLSMGMVDLDDGIAINTFRDFNENIMNVFRSFGHTIYDTKGDLFYRPVAADVMLLNYQVANHGSNIAIFHLVSVLLHIACVLILFRFFRKLGVKELHAFILCMIFAVHPLLTQAVAWISSRVETLLCIFTLSFFINSIDYTANGKIRHLVFSTIFLLLALFDKETAVVIVPVILILHKAVLKNNWSSRRMLIQYAVWAACYVAWFVARTAVLQGHEQLNPSYFAEDILHRIPVLIQYVGKIFLPFNLSVYPLQEDTGYMLGAIASVLLITLVVLSPKRNLLIVFSGFALFFLFLLPTFIIHKNISTQIFEYRAYIPMIGILYLLTQSALVQNKLGDKQLLIAGVVVSSLLAAINFSYQQSYSDPLSFWTQAMVSSPHSAYARMMVSARTEDPAASDSLFMDAYRINPNERLFNFMYGVKLQSKDSVMASEKYLLAEKKLSGCDECDFYLARVAMERKDLKGAIAYLENYLKFNKTHKAANDNLLLLYLDTDQDDKAKEQARRMKKLGLPVPKAVQEHFGL